MGPNKYVQFGGELPSQDLHVLYTSEIFDDRYQWTGIKHVVKKQHHIKIRIKTDLLAILKQNEKLFDSSLGVILHCKVHININSNAKLVHTHFYPMPHIHLFTFKCDLDHLV